MGRGSYEHLPCSRTCVADPWDDKVTLGPIPSQALCVSIFKMRRRCWWPRQNYCFGLPRRVGSGDSKSISISLLSPTARSDPRSLKAVNFSFTQPFIQCILNANSVPGFVREASTLALGFSRFCFQTLSLFNYLSDIFFYPQS